MFNFRFKRIHFNKRVDKIREEIAITCTVFKDPL